jgi:hypothetical protein
LARASEIAPTARSRLDNEQTCTSILATLVTKLHPFEVIAAGWQGATNKLSLTRWLREEGVILGIAQQVWMLTSLECGNPRNPLEFGLLASTYMPP